MFGLILIYFIGRYFFKLSEKYEKSKWGYGILGVATYYLGTIVFAISYGFIYFSMYPYASEDDIDELSVGLLSIPFGIAAAYLLYYLLKRNWKKQWEEEERNRPELEDKGRS